jgi:hypothetical protein
MGHIKSRIYQGAISIFVATWSVFSGISANSFVSAASWDGTIDTTWYQSGKDTFSISKPAELAGLSYLVNQGNDFSGVTITLQADLQMNQTQDWLRWEDGTATPDYTWTPIGVYGESIFQGTFDGNNHTVSGLYQEKSGKVGLFTAISEEAVIRNLRVEESYLSSQDDYAGGICAYNCMGQIENCENGAIVSSWYYIAGGICGANYFGTVSDSDNRAAVTAQVAAGGVAGINYHATISDCYNTGNIRSKKTFWWHCRGRCWRQHCELLSGGQYYRSRGDRWHCCSSGSRLHQLLLSCRLCRNGRRCERLHCDAGE